MDISIVIPLFNEEESLPHLAAWIDRVMAAQGCTYEVIMVDDGSRDGSWQVVERLHAQNACYKGVRFRRNYGKSAALNVGFSKAMGDVVVTMDADLQDSPEEIPEMRRRILEDGYDMVSGWKKKRYDSKLAKNIPSKFFNWTTRRLSGIPLHDFNCGLKAYRREVVKSIEVYGEMHRYIPVIVKWAGFTNIGEMEVHHRKRQYGVTKFGMNRFINGYLDLMSIMFISKFGKQPMHFFGAVGSMSFLFGFVAFVIVCTLRICGRISLTHSVWFYVSMMFILMGLMLFLAGFLGELICRNSTTRNHYLIREEIIE
ncbi:MAG: family 2 glycosyl transferase [bacterium P3]|nr:MAG: family 2 glycosyl transferase [bacterium P3]KWW42060.1 MAG: family 2 glycosyl transferase [bacterium F083]